MPRAKRKRALAALSWLVEYAIALGLWFLFVAKLSWHELVTGAIAAAIAATASFAVRAQNVAKLGASWRDVAQLWRLPRYVLTDSWIVLCVLARHLAGRGEAPSLLRDVPFDLGDEDDEGAVMRRALAVGYTSMTPNSVVLGFDRERGRMIFHQIRRSPVPEMTRRLGARP